MPKFAVGRHKLDLHQGFVPSKKLWDIESMDFFSTVSPKLGGIMGPGVLLFGWKHAINRCDRVDSKTPKLHVTSTDEKNRYPMISLDQWGVSNQASPIPPPSSRGLPLSYVIHVMFPPSFCNVPTYTERTRQSHCRRNPSNSSDLPPITIRSLAFLSNSLEKKRKNTTCVMYTLQA